MKIVYALPFVAAALLGACAPQSQPVPTITVTAPAPTVTVTPPVEDVPEYTPPVAPDTMSDSTKLTLMNEVWSTYSAADQAAMCYLWNTDPNSAWNSFNEGSDGSLDKATFARFFNSKC